MRKRLCLDFSFDRQAVIITIASTLLLMVDEYFTLTPVKVLDRTLLYLIIPVGIILIVFRQPMRDFGFQLGDWQAGAVLTLGSAVILAPILWFVVQGSPAMVDYYRHAPLTSRLFWFTLLELIGWEFFFRGFILFGYQPAFGDHALWLQAVPFALAHLGKPGLETLTTLFGGFFFGWVARRTRSVIYPVLIHVFVALFTRVAAISAAAH